MSTTDMTQHYTTIAQEAEAAAEAHLASQEPAAKLSRLGELSVKLAARVDQRFGQDGEVIENAIDTLNAMTGHELFNDGSETDIDTFAATENIYRANVVYDTVDWFYDHEGAFTKNERNTPYVKVAEHFMLETPVTGAEAVDWESDSSRAIASAALVGLTPGVTTLSASWLSMANTEVFEGASDVVLTAMLTSAFVVNVRSRGEFAELSGGEVFDSLKDSLGDIMRSRNFDWRSDVMKESSRSLNKAIMEAKRNYRDFEDAVANNASASLGDFFKNHNTGAETLLTAVAAYAFARATDEIVTSDTLISQVLSAVVAPGHDVLFASATVARAVHYAAMASA